MSSYSLFEINEFIRQVLALNLDEAVWVRCELAQVQFSKGHCYLELVQKGEDREDIVAQGKALIWELQLRALKNKLGFELETLLQEGMEVLFLAKIDFHERYGLKLVVKDIDPLFTLGRLALKRRETFLRLKKEGLLEKNRSLDLPPVLQKIAIVSSRTAAGLKDFLNELVGNNFGYRFDYQLFPTAMQGQHVSKEIAHQLKKISKNKFDVIVIIRGGGSKLDLAAFDEYAVCKKVANMSLPVISGIGHEVDETLVDKVVHTSLKTPTAVASFIMHHNLFFENQVLQIGMGVKQEIDQILQNQKSLFQALGQEVKQQTVKQFDRQEMMLDFIKKEIPSILGNIISKENSRIELYQKSVQFLSPQLILKRGYSVSIKNGKAINDAKELEPGEEFDTYFYRGKVVSTVKNSSNG